MNKTKAAIEGIEFTEQFHINSMVKPLQNGEVKSIPSQSIQLKWQKPLRTWCWLFHLISFKIEHKYVIMAQMKQHVEKGKN